MEELTLFVTCLIDLFKPEAAVAAVRVLERRDGAVNFPQGQTCCGQFSYNAGYQDQAAQLARHWIETFEATPHPIVALSGSCAAMVVDTYPNLLYEDTLRQGGTTAAAENWKARAARAAERVQEFSQWIDAHDTHTGETSEPPIRVAYHLGCHMRRLLKADAEAPALMARHGVSLVEPEDADQCCGFGGTYSMTEPAVSTALADSKWETIHKTAGVAVTGADMGCLLHLEGRASRRDDPSRVLYLAELLDLAETGQLGLLGEGGEGHAG